MAIEAKPRKVMGIIFFILGVLGAAFASYLIPVSMQNLVKDLNSGGNAAGAVFGAFFLAIFVVLIIGFVFVDAILCIPFLVLSLIFTRKSSLKWVRILSYITDVLFVYVIAIAIFKLVQLLVA